MRLKHAADAAEYLTVGEAAALCDVHPDTIRRWESRGRISAMRTPTGHRRYLRADVQSLISPAPEREAS